MVCLGFEPKVAEWKAQTNPLSYSCTPSSIIICLIIFHKAKADIYFNKRAPGSSLGWRKHFWSSVANLTWYYLKGKALQFKSRTTYRQFSSQYDCRTFIWWSTALLFTLLFCFWMPSVLFFLWIVLAILCKSSRDKKHNNNNQMLMPFSVQLLDNLICFCKTSEILEISFC